MADKTFVTETLQRLVQINSVNPALVAGGAGELEIGLYIHGLLREMGIRSELTELAPGRVNVTGTIKGTGHGKSLMLNAHMDTVGTTGMEAPFSGKIEGGKLYGRGAYDMKGSIAAILGTAKMATDRGTKLNGDLVLSFVADEEFESLGASELVRTLKTDGAIVTEPTDLTICTAHRGFGISKITVSGKTAHGGNQSIGVDANVKMGLLLAVLEEWSRKLTKEKSHPLCGEASIHVPLISGGRSLFIYSAECTIHVERRTLPGETEEAIQHELAELIKKVLRKDSDFKAEIRPLIWRMPYETPPGSAVLKCATSVFEDFYNETPLYTGHTWWEDSAIFGAAGIDTIILGPKGGGIHEEVEWVDIDSVVRLSEILYQTSIKYCNLPKG